MAKKPVVAKIPQVVRVDNVSKKFTLRKDDSLKERIVTFGRRGRKFREEFWALDGVNFSIDAGTTIGLIGHNGSGKSTLLKIIGGIISPSGGRVETRGRIAALLELGAGFHPDLTGRENVYLNASLLGISRAETDRRFDEIVAFSGIGDFIDTQVKFYSSGMFVRLAFSVAIHAEPDILLVDEVLAVGDEAFQRQCLDKIREFQEQGRTIILVTHGLAHVTDFCDRVVLLDHGKLAFDGDPIEGVAKFRDLLEERRLETFSLSGIPDAEASYVHDVQIGSVQSGPGSTFTPGEDLRVALRLEHPDGIRDWNVRMSILNSQGVTAISANVKGLKVPRKALVGSHWVELIFPGAQLGVGTFNVYLALDSGQETLQILPRAGTLTVAPFMGAGGLVFTRPSVRVIAEK
jgi:ABC-2 type transport system ATP-binding protein